MQKLWIRRGPAFAPTPFGAVLLLTGVASSVGCSSSNRPSSTRGPGAAAGVTAGMGGALPSTGGAGRGGAPGASGARAVTGGAGGTSAAGSGGALAAGGASSGMGGTGATGGSATVPFINSNGKVDASTNGFGINGYFYAYADGVTSTQSGNPYRDGMYCVSGTAPGDGDASHWGVGLGLDLNSVNGTKMPYPYQGKITGFHMKLTGTAPSPVRVNFVTRADSSGVAPFIVGTLDQALDYDIADALVPLDWSVDNAGERVQDNLYALQVLAPGSDAAGPIDLCIAEFEPVYDPNGGQPATGPYINSDGFVQSANNSFGIQGPVYAISDGVSTTQSGNPYQNGKYCVSGTFSGNSADWGAGIALDLNHAPGGAAKAAYDPTGKLGGFRIGLSGNTPGPVRINFIVDDPQSGDEPFLVGQLGQTTNYRVAWAEVPTTSQVADAGRQVDGSIYAVQIYLDGSVAGPFAVCVDELTPLGPSELDSDAAPAATGYTGVRTIDTSRLAGEYATWKARHFKDCGDGTACVPRDEGDCISEGIGYGMLLAAGNADQATFDKLWAYFKKNENPNGVMKWQTAACGAAMTDGSATDGELDAALALVQAGCAWGGTYAADAKTLVAAIKASELTTCSGRMVLKPGDNFGGCDRTDPSYVAPGYFKVFATLTNDASWTTLASDSYALLSTLQAQMGGLVPNWSDGMGTPATGDDGKYGPDASRTPWRVAVDYAWFGEPKAATFLNAVAAYVDANGGIARSFEPNSAYRGGLAMSGLPAASTKAQAYTDAWLQTSVDDDTYFPGTLRPLYMLLLADAFPKGCN
jgi:endo-1,4-beta-D-glucanase Y